MGQRTNWNRGPHFESERLDPARADPGNLSFSIRRYEFALTHSVGKAVLDAGCGTGYGARLLAHSASKVVGIDYDPQVIGYAQRSRPCGNLAFAASTITELPFNDSSFDVVVSFEVIEHLPDHEAHRLFFNEVRRVLKRDGRFIISTSNRTVTVAHQRSVGITVDAHLTEMDLATFRTELEREFAVDSFDGMRYQGNRLYSVFRSLDIGNLRLRVPPVLREFLARTFFGVHRKIVSAGNVVIAPSQLRQADHFLALCRKKAP